MGLFLIVLMCVATVLLIRNMNKRIRRLPDSFPPAGERDRVAQIARDAAGAGSSGAPAAAQVEPGRSETAAGAAEAEVAGVSEEQSGSVSGDGRERS
ncbi:hypothetical protein [Actinoplanes lobatus]|nr:hypothetical protein [Actinoplanes lobatus]